MKKIIYILCGILFFASVSSCTPTKEVDGEIEQVFYLNEDNNILQVKLKGSIYEVINLSKSSGAPLPASNLSVSFYKDMTYVFYVDINNDVIELVEQTSKFTVHSLSSFLDNTELNGKISSLIRDDEKSIFFRDSHDDIQVFNFGKDSLSLLNFSEKNKAPKAFGAPEVLSLKNEFRIFYHDVDNYIQVISTSNPIVQNWTELSKSNKASSDLGVMQVNNQEHVFFRGLENEIEHIIYEDGKFRKDSWTKIANRWTQRANAPLAFGSPSAVYTNSQENVFYLDENKQIQNLVYENGKFKCYNWTQAGNLPPCNSDPVVGKVMY